MFPGGRHDFVAQIRARCVNQALCLLWRQWGRLEWHRKKVGGGFKGLLQRRQPELAQALGSGRSMQ